MSSQVFPLTLAGWDIKVTREPLYATRIQTTATGAELRCSFQSTPRYKYTLILNFAREAATTDEVGTMFDFFNDHLGRGDHFLFDDPYDGQRRLVRFDADTMPLDQIMLQTNNAAGPVWDARNVKLISVKLGFFTTVNISAPSSGSMHSTDDSISYTAIASNQSPYDGPYTYTWAFDDGTTDTGATVSKTWATPGDHIAIVTALNTLTGETPTASRSVSMMEWEALTAPGSGQDWSAIASSSDGVKLVLASNATDGKLYTSTDSGANWTYRSGTGASHNWNSAVCSDDGVNIFAGRSPGFIVTSTDSGDDASWLERGGNSSTEWDALGSSSDGVKLLAVDKNGYVWTSTDSGANFTQRLTSDYWSAGASSSDGTKLFVCLGGCEVHSPATTGYIHTSTDSGVNWTERTASGSRKWRGAASSSNGTKLVAVVKDGYIYTSPDSGVSWVEQTAAGSRDWKAVASSSDGTLLAAIVWNGYIYVSNDSGLTWSEQTSAGSRYWGGLAMSSDGTKIVVGAFDGTVWRRA